MLAYQDHLVYFNVNKYGVEDDSYIPKDSHENFVEATITDEHIRYLDLHRSYKIICIQEIGNEMDALVLEDLRTRQIRFLRVFYTEMEDRSGKVNKRFKLVQLGVMPNHTVMSPSPLLKYRSVAREDPLTGQKYQVGLVLRANGRFEVYSDFMLVNEYMNPTLQCVDIETDFNQFYLKFCKDSDQIHEKTPLDTLQFQVRQVRHFWRNRISFNTTKPKKNATSWDHILDKRIAQFFKLFSSIVNFSTFMLVSHRNMISVYDTTQLSSDAEWIDTFTVSNSFIRHMFLKKRDKADRRSIIEKQIADGIMQRTASNQTALNIYKKY